MPTNPVLLTVREVSTLLRVQRAKVYLLIRLGVLQGVKIGSDWRVRVDSVEKQIGALPETYLKKLPLPNETDINQ